MASPEPRRESERERNGGDTQPEQGGVFIRYATINDIDEIKSRQDRHDDRMDRIDDKLDVLIADVSELKARQSGLEARQSGLEARMGRLEDKVDRLEDKLNRLEDKIDKLNAHAFRILIAIIVGLVILIARDFFF